VRVEVRWFASLAERVGTASEEIEVPAGASVSTLWDALVDRHPALADVRPRPMVACDATYARWDAKLDGVREVAFLPPMSGGAA
jgi:molybdopterin converting factor subunit 1